jgi:transcriptional regulator with XRE-family HTH domain
MNISTTNLRDIKKMRLERHWSQDQLAEMSGLSIRTIQQIENGENAGLESLKSLASVFEPNITDSNKKEELEQTRKEEEYFRNIEGLYAIVGAGIFCLMTPLISAIIDSSYWDDFFMVILGAYSLNVFDFFGENWKRKIIDKKFKKNKKTN